MHFLYVSVTIGSHATSYACLYCSYPLYACAVLAGSCTWDFHDDDGGRPGKPVMLACCSLVIQLSASQSPGDTRRPRREKGVVWTFHPLGGLNGPLLHNPEASFSQLFHIPGLQRGAGRRQPGPACGVKTHESGISRLPEALFPVKKSQKSQKGRFGSSPRV